MLFIVINAIIIVNIIIIVIIILLYVTGIISNSSNSFAETFYLDKYELEVTPADWTFYLSALSYLWQLAWICYGIYTVCKTVDDGYMYRVFPVLPPILHVVFSFALACNISWLLIWDREYMEVALVFINLMTCNLYICLVVSLRRLNEVGTAMAKENLHAHIWLVRILVHNGLAMFATWGTVATMFNFAVVLTHRTGAELDVGGAVSFAIFTLEILVWWIFEHCVFEKALRYLFTPYIVVLVSIAGIISKNYNFDSPFSIFTLVLFGLVALFGVIKLILSAYRHYKYPMFDCRARYRVPDVFVESRNWCETQT